MSPVTRTTAPAGPRRATTGAARQGLGVVVPGDWWLLPLGDEDGTRRQIAAMVSHRFGRDDAAAGLRREVRVAVTAAARRAAASGGWLMAYMLTRVGDVPLPATLTAEGPFGPVLRGIRERHGTVPGSPDIPVLICDYWTDPRDGDGLVDLSFSTPVLALRDGLVELFDAIVGTLHRFDDGDDDAVDDPRPRDAPRRRRAASGRDGR